MKFVTRVDVTPVTTGSYQDVDVTTYVGSDSGNVAGVLLRIGNESLTEYTIGIRKKGSTDDYVKVLEDKSWQEVGIGVNSSNIFEVNISNTSVKVYLEGYFLNNEAVFLTNAVDKTPASTGSLQLVDISSDTGSNTAKVAIFMGINNDVAPNDSLASALKYNWTTDITGNFNAGDIRFFWTGVDDSERCNIYIGSANVKMYLVGYLTANVTLLNSLVEYNITSANYRSFYDLDISADVPSGSNGVLFVGGKLGATPLELMFGVRKNGSDFLTSSVDWDASDAVYGICEVDSNRIVEVMTELDTVRMWIFGYTNESNIPGLKTSGLSAISGISKIST